MPWQKVPFPRDDILNDMQIRLSRAFEALFMASGGPPEAGMFQDDDAACYFSPRAVEIAQMLIKQFGGRECPAPRSSTVDLLVGSQSRAGVPFAPEPEPEPEEHDNN
jgi:hypothetical protein